MAVREGTIPTVLGTVVTGVGAGYGSNGGGTNDSCWGSWLWCGSYSAWNY
jgi:hypothetical protein